MDLFSKRAIKDLLKKYDILPKKRFGQNFLIDKLALKKILKAADLKEKDLVLEIGPGIGNLTQELAKKTKMVVAVEKDPKMVEILKETVGDFKNIKIIQANILKIGHWALGIGHSYKIVANLPYYIVSPAIRNFLEGKNPPKLMVLMVQKEVGRRICAKPPDMNLLAVSVQFFAKPKIISFVSKKSFWPQPKVDGAIIKIANIKSVNDPRRKSAFNQRFFTIVKSGFSQPRKQLINNLSKKLKVDRRKIKSWLLKNKIQPNRRAETLSLRDWLKLTESFVF